MSSDTKTKVRAALDDLSTSFQQRADAAKASANATSQAELAKDVAKKLTQTVKLPSKASRTKWMLFTKT